MEKLLDEQQHSRRKSNHGRKWSITIFILEHYFFFIRYTFCFDDLVFFAIGIADRTKKHE